MGKVLTLALVRTRRADAAIRVGEVILGLGPGGRFVDLAYLTPQGFLRAWNLFRRCAARGLSFTDCASVEFIRSLRLDGIASFDQRFDGLVPRRSAAED